MHRHGYQGRKFHRQTDQRQALIKGLADSLVKYETIETTLEKAKEVVPYIEKLITKAKKGDLHNARAVMSEVISPVAGEKLLKELAKGFADRNVGYTRIIKTGIRRGDNAPMAVVELVLPDNFEVKTDEKPAAAENKAEPAKAEKKAATKAGAKA